MLFSSWSHGVYRAHGQSGKFVAPDVDACVDGVVEITVVAVFIVGDTVVKLDVCIGDAVVSAMVGVVGTLDVSVGHVVTVDVCIGVVAATAVACVDTVEATVVVDELKPRKACMLRRINGQWSGLVYAANGKPSMLSIRYVDEVWHSALAASVSDFDRHTLSSFDEADEHQVLYSDAGHAVPSSHISPVHPNVP
mmetsp:Transcript_38920/g.71896  ORF Transcript_38920/g.71896 Transcript_38920/m.71896 type:complete len:194 (-) Transcript_38920:408-989(-)